MFITDIFRILKDSCQQAVFEVQLETSYNQLVAQYNEYLYAGENMDKETRFRKLDLIKKGIELICSLQKHIEDIEVIGFKKKIKEIMKEIDQQEVLLENE